MKIFAHLPAIYCLLFAALVVMVAEGGEEVYPDVVWDEVVVETVESEREEAMHFIEQLRPMVPGRIVWQEMTFGDLSEPEAARRYLKIRLSLEAQGRARLYFYEEKNATLNISWPEEAHKAYTVAAMQVLQQFTQNGVLQPVSRKRLEDALTHHVAYRTLDWRDVQIVCSPHNLPYAQAWGDALQPHIDGRLSVHPQSQETRAGVTLRLITVEGPTQARLRYHGDSSVILQVTETGDMQQNMQLAFAEFIRIVQPFMQGGKLLSVKDGDLFDALRHGFYSDVVTWRNIVVCSVSRESAQRYIEALRPIVSGSVCWRQSVKGELLDTAGLGNDYLCIYLDSDYGGGKYICVQEGVLPAIRIGAEPTPRSRQEGESHARYMARWDAARQEMFEVFVRSVQALVVGGKLKPVSVKELKAAVETPR